MNCVFMIGLLMITLSKSCVALEQQQTMLPASLWSYPALSTPIEQWKKLFLDDVRASSVENEFIPVKDRHTLRVMNFNVRMWTTLADEPNAEAVHMLVRKLDPDILIMQEVSEWEKTYNAYTALGYDSMTASCITHDPPFGVAVFAKNCTVTGTYASRFKHQRNPSRELCFVRIDLVVGDKPLAVYGTHLEVELRGTSESVEVVREQQLAEIFADSLSLSHGNIVIAGDFNSIREKDYDYEIQPGVKLWDLLKQRLNAHYNIAIEPRVLNLFQQNHYQSSFELLGWVGPQYTQWAGAVLDFVFFSPTWALPLRGSYIYYTDISDHLPIVVDLQRP